MAFKTVFYNTAFLSLASIARLIVQFFTIPLISRVLSQSDYGLIGLATPFILFAMMFADAGIGLSLIPTPQNKQIEWSTCFWLTIILGTVIAIIMSTIAPVSATYFNEPELKPILLVLSITVFLQAAVTIPYAKLQQSQRFSHLAIIEIIATLLSFLCTLSLAYNGWGAWSLVFQQVIYHVVKTFSCFLFAGFRPLFVFKISSIHEHIAFGSNLLSVNVIGFLTRSVDNLFIGKSFGVAAVGTYAMAFQFARLPIQIIAGPLQNAVYPYLARIKDNREALKRMFLFLTRGLSIIIIPSVGLIATAYEPAFSLLLSEKWRSSGELFMIVSPAIILQSLTCLCWTIAMLAGRTDIQRSLVIESGIIWLILLSLSIKYGLFTVCVVYDVLNFLYAPRFMKKIFHVIDCSISEYLKVLLPSLVITLIGIAIYLAVVHVFNFHAYIKLSLAIFLILIVQIFSITLSRKLFISELTIWKEISLK